MTSSPSLADHLAFWRAWQQSQNLSERTITERAATIQNLVDYTDADALALTPADIIRYVGRPGLSPATRASYHATIRAWSKYLVRSHQRDDDPTEDTPRPKRPRGVPRPVLDAHLARMLVVTRHRRTHMMILLAALQGLRVHEIAKIHGRDIDMEGRTLTVCGKGSKTRVLPLHVEVWRAADTFPRNGYWFAAYELQGSALPHVRSHAVSKAIKSAMERANVPGTPHALRHWYGTKLVETGTDIRIAMELLRHETLQSTQIYTFVSDVQRREGIDRLELPPAA